MMFASACTAMVDDDGSYDLGKTDEISPTGESATLLVTVPPGALFASITLQADGSEIKRIVTPEEPLTVSPGHHCLWTTVQLGIDIGGFETKKDCFDVPSGSVFEYELGSVRFVRITDGFIFSLDSFDNKKSIFDFNYAPDKKLWAFLSNEESFAHAQGDFSYTMSEGSFSIKFTVVGNQETLADLTGVENGAAIRWNRSLSQALPDTQYTSCKIGQRISGSGNYFQQGCGAILSGAQPILFIGQEEHHVRFGSGDSFDRLGQGFPAKGTIIDVQLERLDVHDVAIALPDGTTSTVEGEVSIEYLDPQTNTFSFLFGGMKTGTGIDVLPAQYRVTVKYKHPSDAVSFSFVEEIDLR